MIEKTCFVVMPVSETTVTHNWDHWKSFFEKQIAKVVRAFNENGCRYTCERLKESHGSIKSNLVEKLIRADVVIAVLTDYNYNVLYELGMRHVMRPGTLILIEGIPERKFPKGFPSDLNDCWVEFYQEDPEKLYLEDIINNFLMSYEKSPHKDCMPYELLRQLSIPYDKFIKRGFRDIDVPRSFFDEKSECNILLINVHKDIFSSSLLDFIESSPCVINLLFTTNPYVQLTRALSLGKTIEEYNLQSGPRSTKYISHFLKYNEKKAATRNVKTYHNYPFGLYLQINTLIWFIPLWNQVEHSTISAYDNMCLQMTRNSDFGHMLYENFQFLWKHACKYSKTTKNK